MDDDEVVRVRCTATSSADFKRKSFGATRTPSIHDDNPNENLFFPKTYVDDVLSEISHGSINGEDEGIGDTESGAVAGHRDVCRVGHSMSAPAGRHKPLKKSSFESDPNFHRGKSLVDTQGLSQDENDNGSKDIGDDVTKARRESYKDSAYGGSEGSTETCTTDDVPEDDGAKRRPSLIKGSKKVNDLGIVPETPEPDSEVFSLKTDKPLTEPETPDFDVLKPRSVSGSESSGSSHSEKDPTSATPRTPGLRPLFEELGLSSSSSMGSADQLDIPVSPQTSDMDKEDIVFPNGYPVGAIEQLEIESLGSAPYIPNLCQRRNWQHSADGSEIPLLPGEPLSLPSVDSMPMSEAELMQMYKRHRRWFLYQHIIARMKRGVPPEHLVSLINRIPSDSDHGSDFSSLGSGTNSLHSSSSGSGSDHIPCFTTMPLAPHLPTIDSVDSSRSVELPSKFEGRSCDAELSVPSFDSEGKLERAACCRQSQCPDEECQEGQRLILYIKQFLDQSTVYTRYHDNIILRTIADHASLCDELKCPIPWCTFFHEHDLPFEDQVANLHAEYFSGQINMTSEDSDINQVELLTRWLESGCKEHVDWSGIARLGGYGNAVLAMTSSLDNPAYWVVKRENKDVLLHVEVLRKLKGKPHPRIVQHLWILEQENYLFIASKFEGASVADRMSESGQTGLPEGQVLRYMEQLASATQFLQRDTVNIAYLNWTADNILASADMRFVKVCNFSCAVPIDDIQGDEETIEDLKMLLPPRIVPPELYQCRFLQTVDTTSDVWGLGCVWFQMCTGHLIYPEMCHFHPATVRDKLEAGPEPDLNEVPEHMRTELSRCLQMDRGARITTPNLHTRLIELIT